MLETGQPIHAYDRRPAGRADRGAAGAEGEKLTTLDDVVRPLDADDLVITDDSGPIGLAGVMGGASTELSASTTERGDRGRALRRDDHGPDLAPAQAVLGGLPAVRARGRPGRDVRGGAPGGPSCWSSWPAARSVAEETVRGSVLPQPATTIADDLPGRVLGAAVDHDTVVALIDGGRGRRCAADGDQLTITAPSWRPDLRDPYDYVEEVGRLIGFEHHPAGGAAGAGRPRADPRRSGPAGPSTPRWPAAGFVEVLSFPFAVGRRPGPDGRAGRRRAPPAEPDRQPAVGDQPVPADLAAARAVRRRGPQPQPGQRRPGPVRGRVGVLRHRAAGGRAAPAGDPAAGGGRAGGDGPGPRPAAAAPGGGADRVTGGARLVGSRGAGRLAAGDRRSSRWRPRAVGRRVWSGGRRSRRPGIPAGARSSSRRRPGARLRRGAASRGLPRVRAAGPDGGGRDRPGRADRRGPDRRRGRRRSPASRWPRRTSP